MQNTLKVLKAWNELTPLPPDAIRSISTPWLKEILTYRRSGREKWRGRG
jgi:hypothetical protein